MVERSLLFLWLLGKMRLWRDEGLPSVTCCCCPKPWSLLQWHQAAFPSRALPGIVAVLTHRAICCLTSLLAGVTSRNTGLLAWLGKLRLCSQNMVKPAEKWEASLA